MGYASPQPPRPQRRPNIAAVPTGALIAIAPLLLVTTLVTTTLV